MKKLYMVTLCLLTGCMINSMQEAGVGRTQITGKSYPHEKFHPLFEQYYEDQLANNEITIEDYIMALEARANKPEWKSTARKLEDMRMANDGRYDSLAGRLVDSLNQYKYHRINRAEFQKQVKNTVDRVHRNQ